MGVGLWDPAYLAPALIQQPLQETRPNVTEIKRKVVLGLGWGTGQPEWLPGAALG